MSRLPGPTRSMVGKTLVAVEVETVTGADQVWPWSRLTAKRILTLPPSNSPQATYTLPRLSTLTGSKFHSVSKAEPVLPVPGIEKTLQVSPRSSDRATPTPPPAAPPFWRL